eukprot:4278269-Pyramimonas_sp.AAC.1
MGCTRVLLGHTDMVRNICAWGVTIIYGVLLEVLHTPSSDAATNPPRHDRRASVSISKLNPSPSDRSLPLVSPEPTAWCRELAFTSRRVSTYNTFLSYD